MSDQQITETDTAEPEHGADGERDEGTVSRRRVLGFIAAGGLAVALGGVAVERLVDGGAAASPEELRLEAIRRIGADYLDRHPEERDAEALRSALPDDWGTHGDDDPWASLRSVGPLADEDAAEGRMVMAGGWLIERTSARAAALLSLEG